MCDVDEHANVIISGSVECLEGQIKNVGAIMNKTSKQKTGARYMWAEREHKRLKAELVALIKSQGGS